jgi:hypothetical protein
MWLHTLLLHTLVSFSKTSNCIRPSDSCNSDSLWKTYLCVTALWPNYTRKPFYYLCNWTLSASLEGIKIKCWCILPFMYCRGLQNAPFRAAYGKIGNLRGFVHCPVLCLTATAGKETRTRLLKALHMRDVSLVKVTPDKPNSILEVWKASGDIDEDFKWLLDELKGKRLDCPRAIVYCRTISSCGELYSMLMQELDHSFCGMFAMFHSKTQMKFKKMSWHP